MRHFTHPLLAPLFAAAGVLLSPGIARADYVFQDIVNSGDPIFNQELAINNAGKIAGYFGDGTVVNNNGYTVVAPYGAANFTAENFPSGTETMTQVTGINNLGGTVGFWVDTSGANHGFTDFLGVFTSVNDPASANFTQLLGVNDFGTSAGFYDDAVGNAHAFTLRGSTFTSITPPDSVSATATDVNDSGIVTGFETSSVNGDTYGFVDDHGTISELLYPGSTFTQFLGLNNGGLVVGVYQDASGTNHGFVYNAGTGIWTLVNDPFAAAGAAGDGTTINGINNKGDLVGFYVNASGATIGLLATPTAVPEPSLFLLTACGALLIGFRRLRA